MGFPLIALAADMPQRSLEVSAFSTMLRMFFGLGIVLLIIAGMVWLLKKTSLAQSGNAGGLRVVSAVAVGPKERVVLVDVGETRLVLGVAPGHVVRLLEMARPNDIEVAPGENNAPSFLVRLKEVIAARGVAK